MREVVGLGPPCWCTNLDPSSQHPSRLRYGLLKARRVDLTQNISFIYMLLQDYKQQERINMNITKSQSERLVFTGNLDLPIFVLRPYASGNFRIRTKSMTTSFPNSCRYSAATLQTCITASGSSAFTWKIGAWQT